MLARTKPFYAGLTGEITKAEIVRTDVQGYNGVRVTVKDSSGEEYVEMCWLRGTVGSKSKLGCLMQELGDDTDRWIGKQLRVIRWVEKDRAIEVIQPKPEGKGKGKA